MQTPKEVQAIFKYYYKKWFELKLKKWQNLKETLQPYVIDAGQIYGSGCAQTHPDWQVAHSVAFMEIILYKYFNITIWNVLIFMFSLWFCHSCNKT